MPSIKINIDADILENIDLYLKGISSPYNLADLISRYLTSIQLRSQEYAAGKSEDEKIFDYQRPKLETTKIKGRVGKDGVVRVPKELKAAEAYMVAKALECVKKASKASSKSALKPYLTACQIAADLAATKLPTQKRKRATNSEKHLRDELKRLQRRLGTDVSWETMNGKSLLEG